MAIVDLHQDVAPVAVTILPQEGLHGLVLFVGIRADAAETVKPGLLLHTVHQEGGELPAPVFLRYRRPVEDAAGQALGPLAVGDGGVARLLPGGEGEEARDLRAVEQNEALAPCHVEAEVFLPGVAVLPLVHPVLFERGLGVLHDLHQSGQILRRRRAAGEGLRQRCAGGLLFQLPQQLPVLRIGKIQLFVQVRTLLPGALELLLPPPAFHPGVVTPEQHLGHAAALPGFGPGVLGVFQQTVPVALPGVAGLVREDPGHQATHGIRHGHGRDLPAGENKISQGDLLVHTLLDEALVHALIVAADQHQVVVIPLEALGGLLVVGLALGTHVDHPAAQALRGGGDHRVQAAFQRLGHHDAAEAPAVGVIVHLVLLVFGIVPDLDAVYLHRALLHGPADDALVQHGADRVGKQGQNIDPHYMPSIKCTVMTPFSASVDRMNSGTAGMRCSVSPCTT